MNYWKADSKLQGRCHEQRKVANNTILARRGEDIALRLHSTDILLFRRDGSVVYNSGGWRTSTTKSRMNDFGTGRIHQHKFTWYVNGEEYFDGFTYQPAEEKFELREGEALLQFDTACEREINASATH